MPAEERSLLENRTDTSTPLSILTPWIERLAAYSRNRTEMEVQTSIQLPGGVSLAHLEASSCLGCDTCRVIFLATTKYLNEMEPNLPRYVYVGLTHDRFSSTTLALSILSFSDLDMESRSGARKHTVMRKIELFTEGEGLDDPLCQLIGTLRDPIQNVTTPQLSQFIGEKLRECAGHDTCGDIESSSLPKRVIDVGDDTRDPFLFIPDNKVCAPYVCLSHCWGNPSFTNPTFSTNLQARMEGIALDELPKTFLEAILLTRVAGFQYIWIDSFCIVQDDLAEWEAEAQKMAEIYQNSIFTLVAAEGIDSRSSLFPHIEPPTNEICSIMWKNKSGAEIPILIRQSNDDDAWKNYNFFQSHISNARDRIPLFARAWTYQELLLPSRLLICSRKGLIWNCNTHFHPAVEAKPFHWKPHRKGYLRSVLERNAAEAPWRLLYDYGSRLGLGGQDDGDDNVLRIPACSWTLLVREYTSRQMTKREDRLRAMAALARKFHKTVQVDYAAGLWADKESLPYFLSWSQGPTQEGTKSCKDPKVCTSTWAPPSWSWASVNAPVVWPNILYGFRSTAEVLDVSCYHEPKFSSWTNSIGGVLEMNANVVVLRKCILEHDSDYNSYSYYIDFEDILSPAQLSNLKSGTVPKPKDSITRLVDDSIEFFGLSSRSGSSKPSSTSASVAKGKSPASTDNITAQNASDSGNRDSERWSALALEPASFVLAGEYPCDYHRFRLEKGQAIKPLVLILLGDVMENNISSRPDPQFLAAVQDLSTTSPVFMRVDSGAQISKRIKMAGLEVRDTREHLYAISKRVSLQLV
ncbi:heterokaryon incompatibility protein-domain-containing protein [Astrocystis sublimbata]|nr:heterokaryon incompatibility protein-domain-containing protein [Astrocystis sublimbata]